MSTSWVECPICGRKLKLITMTHLKIHGYTSKQEFLDEYSETKLVSDDYSKKRSQILGEVNKLPVMRDKSANHARQLNSDSKRQSEKGKKGWTPERRQQKREQLLQVIEEVNHAPEYKDFRERRQQGFSYGKKYPYMSKSGELLNLKSFLECRVVNFLELNQFEFYYEKLEFDYYNTNDHKVHKYFPDFYLPQFNLILEVKSSDKLEDPIVLLKKKSVESLGYNFMFVTEKNLKDYSNLIDQIVALHIE